MNDNVKEIGKVPNADLVAFLEGALKMARNCDIHGMAGVMEGNDDKHKCFIAGYSKSVTSMAGKLQGASMEMLGFRRGIGLG